MLRNDLEGINISIDFDDTLFHFSFHSLLWTNAKLGLEIRLNDLTAYDTPIPGMENKKALEYLFEFLDTRHHLVAKPLDFAFQKLEILQDHGANLFILTARRKKDRWRTYHLLEQYGREELFKACYFTDLQSKLPFYEEHKFDIHFDDAPSHAEEIAQAGGNIILMNQPWNQNTKEHPNIRRVPGWNKVTPELILQLYEASQQRSRLYHCPVARHASYTR